MLARLIDVSGWTHEQWLAASIIAFCIVAVLVVLYRLGSIVRRAQKPDYKPNLRPLRRGRR